MINRIYNTVLFISNNELRGNVAPVEFNLALYNSMLEIYEEYFFEINRQVNRQNRGLVASDFGNLPDYLREKVKYYLKSLDVAATNDTGEVTWSLPGDLRYIDGVFYNGNEVEPTTNSRQFLLAKKNPDLCVDLEYPLYLQRNRSLHLAPTTITGALTIDYLRNPLVPNWTYNIVNNAPVYNPASSTHQDVDMHVSEESNLIRKVLFKMGINLKEQDLANYMANMEQDKFQKENIS